MPILRASIAYWALIFGLGFVLGTVRVLWLAPMVGETLAPLIELPVMLAASWFAARWCVRRWSIASAAAALAMGALAFAVLMGAELALALTLFDMDARTWLADILQLPGLFGFAGQIAFGLMPWAVVRLAGRTP